MISTPVSTTGNISEHFKVGRSCRQGDPTSPYLFNICVEILALKIRKDSKVKGFNLGSFEQKLDFYADDLTAYLDGSQNSLINVIKILEGFKNLSGLKINLSKCKAVWIGKNRFLNIKICEDYPFIWTNKFRLLGVDFDSDLANMDTNFLIKLQEIDKLFKSWLFRHLTPYGKVTIIKSMALSKLSHIVLVCPHLGDEIVQKLKNMIYKFLWNNKPDRIKRSYAMLPCQKGGLNLPDVTTFWQSLKMSWSRKLMKPNSLWQKILTLNLLYQNLEMKDVWYGGPNLLKNIAANISNKFWSEVINIFAIISEELHFAKPFYFYNFNIFDNNLFSINGMELRSSDFQSLWRKNICQAGDFFHIKNNHPELLSLEQMNQKFSTNLNFLNFHRIKHVINEAAKKLNFKIFDSEQSDLNSPRLPLIHKISCVQKKGCRIFYEVLKAREWSKYSTVEEENKWHSELGVSLSVTFWDKIWGDQKHLICSNKMKWINLQILRFTLPTNYSVNKYKPSQDPRCSFCLNHLEKIPTLVWSCPVVRDFWTRVGDIINIFFPDFNLGQKEAIFGDCKSKGNSALNTILILAKQFIWTQKFGNRNLCALQYKRFMKNELKFMLDTMHYKENIDNFHFEWFEILQYFEIY